MAAKDNLLTPEQRARLQQLEDSIAHDRVTVGFSIEDRDPQGRKKWALFTTTVSPKGDASSWTPQELPIVSCLVSKRVVLATYRDAFRRGIMTREAAAEEAQGIVDSYDTNLANLLKNGDDE